MNTYTDKTTKFVERAKEIHGNKYNYKHCLYSLSHSKVIITCKIHGDFFQTPHDHLQNHGCQVCGKKQASESTKKNIKFFIQKANQIHNLKYSYVETIYFGCKIPIIIICPIHGKFIQTPNNHLSGFGCQKC